MTRPSYASVYFFLDNQQYAYRTWTHIPSVGDEVMLGPDSDRTAYVVKRLVWGNEGGNMHEPQRVNIEIKRAEPEASDEYEDWQYGQR